MDQWSFFGLSEHLERISKIGDPLEVLEVTVDFEYFRGWLIEGLGYGDGAKGVQMDGFLTAGQSRKREASRRGRTPLNRLLNNSNTTTILVGEAVRIITLVHK